MIRHIAMFILSAKEPVQRAADIAEAQERLSSLIGVVPGLRSITFQPDQGLIQGHWDAVLVSEHDDNAALEAYQIHPDHVEAGAFVLSITDDRIKVDYEF